ncbi:hypothetical protein ABIB96_005936 [Bradyrhizobium sp. LA3.X]
MGYSVVDLGPMQPQGISNRGDVILTGSGLNPLTQVTGMRKCFAHLRRMPMVPFSGTKTLCVRPIAIVSADTCNPPS